MEDEYLSLGVGKFETEWLRNTIGPQDHSILFKDSDKTDIPYYFLDDDANVDSKLGQGYSTALKDLRERLDLLGYSFDKLPTLLMDYFSGFPSAPLISSIDTQIFIDLLSDINVNDIDWTEHEGDADPGEFFTRRILSLPQFGRLRAYLDDFKGVEPYVYEQIDPYIILAAIAKNPQNNTLTVEWRHKGNLAHGLDTYQKYLIVTEGYTDGRVIKMAMEILKPNVTDFFDYIDMNENYPFGGAGSLSNFFKGLTKIGTNRKIIFIFDNDAEGNANLQKLINILHPVNFKKFALPDMHEFNNFETVGPTGTSIQNVNKRAVAIEMFLDMTYNVPTTPIVRWSSFEKTVQQYQGALENKTKYYDEFMALTPSNFSNYNFSLLEKLLNYIIAKIVV
ncbi:HEPN/Toprim-associated domain-containing protein [Sphingobacterium bovistauri]|uniref:HEPN/Toprim N-terminal domain-containing protein n=1 Tax=Sphingobacterium bovistauri TaxID=2781959 RepID=A0ABS7ZAD9_9SPHI|nr:HEPN/Toprim-associated domain-containing protein [Sphingobacterium bovistauri]MCA5005669.1 hypothetical protein [Sphingobacterium bovistauri]